MNLGGWELLLIFALLLLLFGASRLPKLARSTGQSLRILKSEVRELKSDEIVDEP